jgi:hypothetical protein
MNMQPNNQRRIINTGKSPIALAITAAISAGMSPPSFAFGDGEKCAPIGSTFLVTTNLGDESVGTLRAAIELANDDADCSQIEFANDVTHVSLEGLGEVNQDLNIVGHGRNSLVLSTDSNYWLNAFSGALHVSHLTSNVGFGNYSVSNFTVDDVLLDGGGVVIEGRNTVIRNSTITNTVDDPGILFNYSPDSTLLIDNSVISNNRNNLSESGGGLYAYLGDSAEIKISNSTFTGNSAPSGGGIFIEIGESDASLVTIEDSTINGNESDYLGAGVAIYNYGIGAEVRINRSTIANNTSVSNGGGIYVRNGTGSEMDMSIEQTTISGNESVYGGGIYYDDSDALAPLTIKSSTIVNNVTRFASGGIHHIGSNDGISIENSVIALNTTTTSSASSGWVNLSGVFNSVDHSWLGDNNGYDVDGNLGRETLVDVTNPPTDSVTSGDDSILMLGDLADNGGPTQTHLPQANSPLLEMGNPATADLSTTDQRGSARQVGVLDIGAVESGAALTMDISLAAGTFTINSGEAFNIDLNDIAGDDGVTISVSGLPSGVSFDANTNIISGAATQAGASEITVSVANFDASISDTLDLLVLEAPALPIDAAASSSDGLGSFGYGWLLMLAGVFVRRKY